MNVKSLIILVCLLVLSGCTSTMTDTTSEMNVSSEMSIPENCVSWFDGCNTCSVSDNQLDACTMKFCPENDIQEAQCVHFDNNQSETTIPSDCTLWFDGCNRCMVANSEIKGCTKMACSDEAKSPPRCLQSKKDDVNQ